MTVYQFQFRRQATEVWASANPILAAGEPGVDTTAGRMKVGDGVTHWLALGWSTMSASEVQRAVAAADAIEQAGTPTDAVIATQIGTPTSATRQALNATFGVDAMAEAASTDGNALRIAIENIAGNYEPEALALFDRMSVRPDADRRAAISGLISALKASGLWASFDAFYVLAAHSAQAALLNWVAPAADLIAVNSPAFIADRGYKGNGTTSDLDQSAKRFSQFAAYDMQMSVWALSGTANVNMIDIGFEGIATRANTLTGTETSWRANFTAVEGSTAGALPGFFSWQRLDATAAEAYYNGARIEAVSKAAAFSDITPAMQMRLLRYTSAYSDRELAFASYGSSLSQSEQAALYNVLADYMEAVGL